eukprot:3106743-Prymnesium_polylepis.1
MASHTNESDATVVPCESMRPAANDEQPAVSFVYEIADEALVRAATSDAAKEAALRAGDGKAVWLAAFWFATQQRKHGVIIAREGRSGVRVTGCVVASASDVPEVGVKLTEDAAAQLQWDEDAAKFEEHWSKQINAALKKVEVEDLGAMDAARLWEAIPEEDGAGRGRNDLTAIERELSVKVCFCEADAHVLLVGAKA